MGSPFTPHTFEHSLLGTLTGRLPTATPLVASFRSIPFARIPARFRQSILVSSFDDGESRDFTQFGTACPSVINKLDHAIVGGLLPGEQEKKIGEFDCLNLTVNTPVEALGGHGKLKGLPVMVYVHGGAFKVGTGHISEMHDTSRLVNLSIEEGHPVVIVNIHYRLNWCGFLACQDLLDEAESNHEPPSNFGFYDQRNAFFWLKKFIAGFGGDPERITAFGESAGSGSLALRLSTDIPLFNRAILQSGTTATGPLADLPFKEAEYKSLLKFCGIDENTPDRLAQLRSQPWEKLVEASDALNIGIFAGLNDAQFFTRGFPNWATETKLITSCSWVDSIVIGDCYLEGWAFTSLAQAIKSDLFIQRAKTMLGVENTNKLLQAYGIQENIPETLFWTKLMYLLGDIVFSEPTHRLASALAASPIKTYRYTITVRNPFPGTPLYQIPGHHFIDVLFLFGTLMERYSTQKLRDISRNFGLSWLAFGRGEGPWAESEKKEEKIMVISGKEGWVEKTRERDEIESWDAEEGERRYVGWEAITAVRDDVTKEVWEKFLSLTEL